MALIFALAVADGVRLLSVMRAENRLLRNAAIERTNHLASIRSSIWLTHSYLGGSSFAYKVCRAGASTTYGFCPTVGGATIFATIKAGISGCP